MKFKSNIRSWLQKYLWPIKIFLTLLLLWAIWTLYFQNANLSYKLKYTFQDIKSSPLLWLVGILTIINWLIEALKWNYLANKITSTTFFQSVLGTFAGITFSAFLPNRTGEFAGRILFLPLGYRIRGIFASFIGSYAQFSTTLIFGGLGLILYTIATNFQHWITISLLTAYLIFLGIWSFTFFNPHLIFTVIKSITKNKKILKLAKTFKLFKVKTQFWVLLLSMFRYVVFTTQFILLLELFNANINLLETIAAVLSGFFINTLVPSFTVSELGVREVINVQLFTAFTNKNDAIIYASFLLWLFNIVGPSIVGAGCILAAKFKK